jgi:butyryl-CoA dehydrogenase
MSIYEGTSGIQSIDLVGRKMLMQEGRALSLLLSEIYSTMDAAGSYAGLKNYVYALNNALEGFAQVRQHLNGFIRNGELEKYLADASLVMELTGLICSGWQWLKQGMAALKSMEIQRQHGADTIFYTSKMHTLAYFFKYELPKTKALVKTLLDQEMVTIKKDPEILI